VRILQRGRAEGAGDVDLGGVRVDGQAGAGIQVAQQTDVQAEGAGRELVAAIEVDLGVGVAAAILDPLDGGGPGADIEAALVREVGTALDRRLQAALGDAAVAVVGDRADVDGQRVVRLRGLGLRQQRARSGERQTSTASFDFIPVSPLGFVPAGAD
jgi:hypothetical protein